VTVRGERILVRSLWTAFGLFGAAGLGVLAYALFTPRPILPPPAIPEIAVRPEPLRAPDPSIEALARLRMSRRLEEGPREPTTGPSGPVPIDSILRLKGVLDFGGKQPSLAVIELAGERKTRAYQAGDKIGGSGAILHEVGDQVVVEYDRRRYRLTYKGAKDLGSPVGDRR